MPEPEKLQIWKEHMVEKSQGSHGCRMVSGRQPCCKQGSLNRAAGVCQELCVRFGPKNGQVQAGAGRRNEGQKAWQMRENQKRGICFAYKTKPGREWDISL